MNRLPLLAPMSEVAGRLAVEAGCFALRRPSGGRGLLLGGVPGIPPAIVTIIGAGVVGMNAAPVAAGLGAEVQLLERPLDRLRAADDLFQGRVRTKYSSIDSIESRWSPPTLSSARCLFQVRSLLSLFREG